MAPWSQQGPLGVKHKIAFTSAIFAGRFLEPFGGLPGGLQERKVRDVSCETHGFESGREWPWEGLGGTFGHPSGCGGSESVVLSSLFCKNMRFA